MFVLAVWFRAFGNRPIGIADNGDFPKLLGRVNAWPPGSKTGHEFRYFISDYVLNPRDSWNSHIPSVELWVTRLARYASKAFLEYSHFDIRFMGAIHALFLISAVWLFLRSTRPLRWGWRLGIAALILAIFTDLEYLEFLNCAFMDAGSIFSLVLLGAAGIALAGRERNWKMAALFGASAAWFLGSKIQHEPALVPLLLFCLYYFSTTPLRRARVAWAGTMIVLVSTTLYMNSHMPQEYQAESLFSLVFLKLAPLSAAPSQTLRELGRTADDLKYVPMHAWSPGSPLTDARYRDRFWRDVTRARVTHFYLRHLAIALRILDGDLHKSGADVPVSQISIGLDPRTYTRYGLLRRSDNPAPNFRPPMWNPWSDFRRGVAEHLPYAMPLLYLFSFGIALWRSFAIRGKEQFNAWPLVLLLCGIGVLSFSIGSLADATDTARHIVTYQVATDLILLTLAYQGAHWAARSQRTAGPA